MIGIKPKKGKNTSATATINNGALVLSAPGAVDPVVWRMNLADAKEAAFEVATPDEDGASYKLALKSPGKDRESIAGFQTREQAVDALMAVSAALENAPADNVIAENHKHHKSGQRHWVSWLAGIVVLVLLLAVLVNTGPQTYTPPQNGQQQTINSQQTSQTNRNTSNDTGVPVSADDFLRNR